MRNTNLILAALMALAPCAARAAEISEHWIPDQNGCLAANPAPAPNERVEWSGDCVGGYIEGEGILTWYEGERLIARDSGNFSRGALSGSGRIESAEGWSYEGAFPGNGIMRLPDGSEVPAQTLRENNGWHIEQVIERGL
jgi:hypothetical protein